METYVYIGLAVFFAIFIYSLAGFGNSLLSTPFLIPLLGIQQAVPLVSMMSITSFIFVIYRFRKQFSLADLWRPMLLTVFTVPLGVWVLTWASADFLLLCFGLLIILYVAYRGFKLPFPKLANPNWGFLFGALSGFASGMFAAAGPPMIVYADSQEWEADRFRANMASFFMLTNSIGLVSHAVAGNITRTVLTGWLVAIPCLSLALLAGRYTEQFINKARFKLMVYVLLLVIGVRLVLSAVF